MRVKCCWLSVTDEMLLESLQRTFCLLWFFCLVSVNILRSFAHLQYFDIHADLAGSPLKSITSEMRHYYNSPHDGSICKEILLISFWFQRREIGCQNRFESKCPITLIFALHTLCNLENMQAYIIMCPCRHLTCLWFQRIVQYVYNRLNIEDYHMVLRMWPCLTYKSCARLEDINPVLEMPVQKMVKGGQKFVDSIFFFITFKHKLSNQRFLWSRETFQLGDPNLSNGSVEAHLSISFCVNVFT